MRLTINRNNSKVALIIGNGFSLDVVQSLGLYRSVALSRIIPPSSEPPALLMPLGENNHDPEPIWQRHLFPLLWDDLEQRSINLEDSDAFHSYCRILSNEESQQPTFAQDGAFTIHPTAAYQFRCYLWGLFQYYDMQVVAGIKWLTQRCEANPLAVLRLSRAHRIIERLYAHTHLNVISYNYDCIAEQLLMKARARVCIPAQNTAQVLSDRTTNDCVVLKPHGSVSLCSPHLFTAPPRPWLANLTFTTINLDSYSQWEYPPTRFPLLPEIVPPGQDLSSVSRERAECFDTSRRAVRDTDVLICYGFSARPPDDAEFGVLTRDFNGHTTICVCQSANSPPQDIVKVLDSLPGNHYYIGTDSVVRELGELLQINW